MFSSSSSGRADTRSSSQSHLRNRSSSHSHSFKSKPRLDRPNANTYTPKLNENSPRLPTRATKFNDVHLGLDVNVGAELDLDYEARKFKSFKFPRADFSSPLSPESPASPLMPITPRTPVSLTSSHSEKQILRPNDYLLGAETDRNRRHPLSSLDYGHGGNEEKRVYDDDYANCICAPPSPYQSQFASRFYCSSHTPSRSHFCAPYSSLFPECYDSCNEKILHLTPMSTSVSCDSDRSSLNSDLDSYDWSFSGSAAAQILPLHHSHSSPSHFHFGFSIFSKSGYGDSYLRGRYPLRFLHDLKRFFGRKTIRVVTRASWIGLVFLMVMALWFLLMGY